MTDKYRAPLRELHVLDGGFALCHFMEPMLPGGWPAGHQWISVADFDAGLTGEQIACLCETCKRQAIMLIGPQ